MSKRIRFPRALLASILAVMVILLPVEIVASGASASNPVGSGVAEVNGTGYGSFDEAFSAWSAGSTLKLMSDVTVSSTITVSSGEHTLDLNGHGIKMTGDGAVIKVIGGSTLNMNDSDTGATHKFDVPDGAGVATLNEASGTYTVKGGYITGGNEQLAGGVYILDNGTFNMYGGCIIGNKATLHGGGVDISAPGTKTAIFKMYGGSICYNSAPWGGGINVFGNAYVNEGCTIHHNTASNGGGGIELESGGNLYLNGSTVTENVVLAQNGGMWKGGGVHVPNGTECHLQGAVQIKDNYRGTFGTAQSNVFVRQEVPGKVILDSSLTSNTPIGVGTNGAKPFTVTSAYGTYHGTTDPSKYFTSDYSDYKVILNNGEAGIIEKPVATVTSGSISTDYADLSSALNAWTAGSTLKLLGDVTTTSPITVPTGEKHTLDLNGYGILMTGNDRVITINQGASLELNDSNPDRIHYITLTDYRGTAVSDSGEESVSNGNGVIKVTGGYLTGGYRNNTGNHDKCGAGVYNWGTFVLNGGSIVGNRLERNSGGAIRNSGYFTMNGGTIAFNKATGNGGGVTTYVPGGSQGKMTMNGGVISDNYCGSYGGGLQIAGPFEMTGGSVVRNTAATGGSGIFYDGKGEKFKLSGNPIIKDNTNNDLYLGTDATFMINGSLTEGADIHVFMVKPAEFTVGWKDNMGNAEPSDYFKSDDSNYIIIRNANGELEMIDKPAATVTSGDNTSYYSELSSAINAWTAGSTLRLMTDVTTSSTITVPSGEHTLDLNGYTITRTGATGKDNTGLAMTVGDGVNLTVTGPGKITGGSGFHGGGIHVEGNSSVVLDNCEISGNTGHYGGGLYLKNGTITMKNGTVVKENSASEGFGGSGIYAEGSGTLIMDGCTFTNNENRNNGQYAVFLCGNANAKISGAPLIYDNKYGSAQHNLYMFQADDQHSYVLINGELTDGAKIGVGQRNNVGEYTRDWKDKMGDADPTKYFISDNTDYEVFANKDGELEIGYPEVPDVSAEGFEGDYDGEAHKISVTAPDGATVKYGTEEGNYTLSDNPSYTDAGTYTVYYEVSKDKYRNVSGLAEVKINKINATVTITGHTVTADYNGNAHSADGYDATADTDLYDVTKDFTYNGSTEIERTNAGKTDMGLSADKFENTNANFDTVTFNVTDGYVKINKINATVTITGHNTTVDYNGSAHSADGYDATADTDLYDVTKDFTFNGRAEAVRTDAGKTDMGLSADKFENTNANFDTVTFIITDGYVKVNIVDAVITSKPHAKDKLVYNGKAQELVVEGVVDGGTLMYALGSDSRTAPADSEFSTSIPTAAQVGNYYIWYKVDGDKNHYSIAPNWVKITLAEKDWVTISGVVTDSDGSTPSGDAEIILMSGNKVIDRIDLNSDGEYYFTVDDGVYNIVVKTNDTTVTNIVNIPDTMTFDIVMPQSKTDSVLDVVDSDKSIVVGGLDKEAESIRTNEGISSDKNVTVTMTVKAIAETDTKGSKAISNSAQDMNLDFYNLKVEKTIDSITSTLDGTDNVLEIVIPCSFTNKKGLTVYDYNGSSVKKLTESSSKNAGTFRVDKENGLVYVYLNHFSTIALGYKPYYSIKSDMSLGGFKGKVSVKLVKDSNGEKFELNNVSVDDISFKNIPKGTYSMTITWTDGAENKITLPFTVKK